MLYNQNKLQLENMDGLPGAIYFYLLIFFMEFSDKTFRWNSEAMNRTEWFVLMLSHVSYLREAFL